MDPDPCPCGSGRALGTCCGPLLAAEAEAVTAEELMRSRYTAHVYGNAEHLWRTWDGRTRPPEVHLDDTRWLGPEVRQTIDGGPEDSTGIVDFIARHTDGELAERSEFTRRGGRWFYTKEI
ncbi:YchJ family metal-binding protein [Janibacter limosus]|uniref:YchJ family protein n=1 Tax=Janibacter limosus TaxID=53458 RepID=UPI0035D940D9|nr:YchJ family metal-binding protein [Janibacter limosus]